MLVAELKAPENAQAKALNQVLRLKLSGESVGDISSQLGLPTVDVSRFIDDAMALVVSENAALSLAEVALECARLDAMMVLSWGIAHDVSEKTQDRVKAIDSVVRIVERRAKKLGTDRAAPMPSGPNGYVINILPVVNPNG